MRSPIYRVGQAVTLKANVCTENNKRLRKCRIIYPFEDGSYFVRVEESGGYAIVEENNILYISPCQNIQDPNKIRIVFFGNGQFALPTLEMLVKRGYNVVAVITMPDKTYGRNRTQRTSAIKGYAESKGLTILQPQQLNSPEILLYIKDLNPTLGIVADFRILPKALFSIPTWGTINLHSSLLPMYRGASTITSAIKDGREITGVTVFMLDEGIDTGNIINNLAIPINGQDSAGDLHIRLSIAGAKLVEDAIKYLAYSCPTVPQNEITCEFIQPTYAPKLYRPSCMIPWWRTAEEVYNFIRAHSYLTSDLQNLPTQPQHCAVIDSIPTAWTYLKMFGAGVNTEIKIYKAAKTNIPKHHHAPGELIHKGKKLLIACSDELLSIEIVQLPGKKRMTATEFCNGLHGVCKGFCQISPFND